MDSVDICAASSARDNKRRVNKKNRDWHKRLHLRKTAVRPPAMQSEDKHGPKKIVGEWERSTAWPSSKKKPPRRGQQSQGRTNDGENTLRFTCSQCKDDLEYVPKDLERHFKEKHTGIPPVFSCHLCTFSTPEFSYLQVHLISHKDTFSSCTICKDNVQRTWPEFSAHLTMCHCPNGKYFCEMCQKFSTSDVRAFLEHVCVHNSDLEGADDVDVSLRIMDKNQFGPKTAAQSLRCQHCGYEASHKWLITKHIKAVHVCQNGNQSRRRKKVHSIAMKPNDTIPKMKPRLTRSAVREMCWLTEDCLSLPGREFLDKYCQLSDPQTTLEETQQFLMKSVAGETDDQKWTKALKTVLSNVPQDMNLHPKSENGIMSDSSDVTFLTVKNKITVAQNGATYAKRLKMMPPSDKEPVSPESSPAADAQSPLEQNGCQSDLIDPRPCPQGDDNLLRDVSLSVQSESSVCTQMQENRENQELKTDQDVEEHGKKPEGPAHADRLHVCDDVKLTNEVEELMSVRKAPPKKRRHNRRRKRKSKFKRADKTSPGLALKLVLKKNPVKVKQWVSQSSLSPSGSCATDCHHGLPDPHTATEEMGQIPEIAQAVHQQKCTRGSKPDPSEAISLKPADELAPSCGATLTGSKNQTGNAPAVHESLPSARQEMHDDAEKSLHYLGTEVDRSRSADRTSQGSLKAASVTEMCPENKELQTSHSGTGCHASSAVDGVTPCSSSGGGGSNSSPASHPVITSQGKISVEDSSFSLPAEQSTGGMRDRGEPSDLPSSIHTSADKAIQQGPSPAAGHRWWPIPKNLERTLKLVAINPYQLVKRPVGDQPVVVLNHPDADIPEVTRIMEIVNRNKGEVKKVMLSRKTLAALSALSGEVPEADDSTGAQAEPARHAKNCVQERFTLKLKLRRLSRKKYEIVGAVSPGRDALTKFRCWFCGRVFTRQETWMAHRQRHLMEWNKPNCENS
ncbi:zinc finger protein 518A isoform X2 [Mugil cephalus]|nr:zinc finger protein 518A isoform X2 [Mugil cephalus]